MYVSILLSVFLALKCCTKHGTLINIENVSIAAVLGELLNKNALVP